MAMASIYGGWGDAAQEWMLEVVKELEELEELRFRIKQLEK